MLDLDRHFSRVPVKRAPRAKRTEKGAWRFMADGSPSSDGIHADIAGVCRLMFGPPGICNSDGVLWYGVEQRGTSNASRGATFLRDARGIAAGTPEHFIWWWKDCFPFEIKRSGSVAPITGRKVQPEGLTAAQEVVHPEFKKLGRPVVILRSREEQIAWVVQNGLPHRRVVL